MQQNGSCETLDREARLVDTIVLARSTFLVQHPGQHPCGGSLTFFYGAVETMRLFLASKGNKAEQINPLVM